MLALIQKENNMSILRGGFTHNPIFYDLETSGLDPKKHEIIQIAAYSPNSGEYLDIYVEFDVSKADPDALKLNKYDPSTPRMPLKEALLLFTKLCNDNPSIVQLSHSGKEWTTAVLHGYNNIKFDRLFIEKAYRDNKMFQPFHYNQIDWFNFVLLALPNLYGHKQVDIAAHFNIKTTDAHDALGDVVMLQAIAQKINPQIFKNGLQKL